MQYKIDPATALKSLGSVFYGAYNYKYTYPGDEESADPARHVQSIKPMNAE